MRTILSMGQTGNFTVSDDPDSVYADALHIILAAQHADLWRTALAKESNGHGFRIEGYGSISRVSDRKRLPPPLRDNLEIDLESHELWFVTIEKTHTHPTPRHALIDGDELRELVQDAAALRMALVAPVS